MQQPLMFKLDQNPEGRGLRCDGEGLFLGSEALLSRDRQGNFDARPAGELQNVFGRVYGDDETNWESRIRSVKLVANALNKGEMARAMMTAVLMRLPEPADAIRIAHENGVLAKAGFNPDEARDGRGRWARGGASDSAKDHASTTDRSPSTITSRERHAVGVQVADAAMSDAINDPLVEASRRAAELAAQRTTGVTHSPARPAGSAHEDFWQALGSKLSDRSKALLFDIGNAEAIQSNANFAEANAQPNAVRDALRDYGNYRTQPWIGPDGKQIRVPVIDTGDPLSDRTALMGHDLFEPSAPLTRPATNADWIDPLINLASLGATVASPGLGLEGEGAAVAAETLDTTELSANTAEELNTLDQLSAAASRAAAKVGQGAGRFHGTAMHSAFRVEVDVLANPNLLTERSYLEGVPVDYGTPGSVRLDVVEGPIAKPTAIYDLKTGSAILTRSRIREIRSHLPEAGDGIPIHEVRP